jgi:hypothetical protein
MARRRRSTPVPLLPVAAAVRYARRRRANRTTEQETKDAQALQKAMLATIEGRPAKSSDLKADRATVRRTRGRAFRYRHRKTLAPIYVAVLLALSKLMLHTAWTALAGMLLGVSLAVASVFWVRRTSRTPGPWPTATTVWPAVNDWWNALPDSRPGLTKRVSPRAAALAGTVVAGLWWLLPIPAKLAAWLLVGAVTLACTVRRYRFRIRIDEPAAETSREQDWAKYIADDTAGSVMVGASDLHSPRDGALIGWSAGIEVPKGTKGATAIATDALRGQIGTVWDVDRGSVLFDMAPDAETGRQSERRFTVTVIDQPGGNALDEVHPYSGSDMDPATGIFTHSIRADWEPARVRSYDPAVGAYHWHVSGMNGAGKSEGIETNLRSMTQHGLVVPIFCDLGDLTYTDWEPYTPIMETDPYRCLQVLQNLVELIKHRQRKMKTMRRYDADGVDIGVRRVYPISRETPLIQHVFDEWHLLWGNTEVIGPSRLDTLGAAALAATAFVVGQGRKAMVSELLATQSTSVPEGFGGSTYIRQQCQAGNMIGYRNGNSSGGQAFGGQIIVDPSTIPGDRKGTCFLTSPVDARDAQARTIWVREPMKLNQLIDIPELPSDELTILRAGLDTMTTVAAPMPAVPATTTPERKAPKGPSAELVFDVRTWIDANGPVRRQEIVTHFQAAGRGSSSVIDAVLKMLREEKTVTSRAGTYSAVRAAVEERAS